MHANVTKIHTVQLPEFVGVVMANIATTIVALVVVSFQYIQLAVITIRAIVRVLVEIETLLWAIHMVTEECMAVDASIQVLVDII